jgi:hypothetical protein
LWISKATSLVAANLLRRLKDAVHSTAKMLHEDQGHASVLSEPAGSETNPGSDLYPVWETTIPRSAAATTSIEAFTGLVEAMHFRLGRRSITASVSFR